MNKDFCKRLALGGLIQGCFHNLNGNLQTLSFHLQLLYLKKAFISSEEISSHIDKAFLILQKIQKQVKGVLDRIKEEREGPWDLKEVLEEELLFWENFLPFKHKVNKEIKLLKSDLKVKIPLNLLRGILCNIAYEIFPSLKEETNLKFLLNKNPYPRIVIILNKNLEKEVKKRLQKLSRFFKNWVKLKIENTKISIDFYE